MTLRFLLVTLFGSTATLLAQSVEFEIKDQEAWSLIFDDQPESALLVDGLSFAEGPVWDPASEGRLIYGVIPRHQIFTWQPKIRPMLRLSDTKQGNGNEIDHRGRLLTAERHGRRIKASVRGQPAETVAFHYQGKRINSPHDVVIKSDGNLWFTDPHYGLIYPPETTPKPLKEQDANHVFRFDPVIGNLNPVVSKFFMPNGLCFSPDESRLYVSNTGDPHHIRVFPVNANGTLSEGRAFKEINPGSPIFVLEESTETWFLLRLPI